MPPESFLENGIYDEKVDIWGLGCFLYKILTGKRPFAGNNIESLIINIS